MLQVAAFTLVIATAQVLFTPDRPYGPPVAYSLAIGLVCWAIIDLGRNFFPSAAETGWPQGPAGIALVVVGIAGGFFIGNRIGDALCHAFGLGAGAPPVDAAMDLRSSVMITVLAGIVGSYYFYSVGKSNYLERKMGEARRHADEARLKLLETQLEPHMLFNTLANLRALIGVDPERAQHMLDHMIAYLRATLDASRATTHPLGSEFDRLRDYLELMAIRMGPRLAFTLELPPDLAGVPVPTLLLQPLVENSIQHGLEPKVEGGRITVRAAREGGQLVITVDDTGVGDGHGPSSGNGFGLAQIRERLAALHGDEASLDFRTGPDGAHARITLPLE
ncbi:MAG: histidine kinase [Burkholderiales bacterium]|nr:histidine kinase [Burkholderiales bacterium]